MVIVPLILQLQYQPLKIKEVSSTERGLEKVQYNYSRSSRKRPPWEFEKVVVTGAGRLREWALVSDRALKQ